MLYAARMTVSVAIEPGAVGPVYVVIDDVHFDARRLREDFRHAAADDDGYAGDVAVRTRSQAVGRRAGQGSPPPEFSELTQGKQQ
jgi:hypothetical protein